MCGIVSIFGQTTALHEQAFKNMLVFDQVRGEHSTGAAFVGRSTDTPLVSKAIGTPDNLFETKSFTAGMAQVNRAMIGHNRYATVGKINRENAHPFSRGAITGVHNGSLRAYSGLEGYGKFEVDSEVLYNHIDAYGLKDAVSKTMGAMALIWWNEQTNTLNFYRNAERPLYFAGAKDGRTAFLASEGWMISAAAGRQRTPIELREIQEVPPEQMFTFEVPRTYYGELSKPLVTPVPFRKETSYFFPQASYVRSAVNNYASSQSATSTNVTQIPAIPSDVECVYYADDTIHNHEWAVFYDNSGEGVEYVMPASEANSLKLKHGDVVNADCNGLIYHERTNSKGVTARVPLYKLKKSSVTLVGEGYTVDETPKDTQTGDDEPVEQEFINSSGKDIGRDAWYRLYGVCSYCSADVSHTDLFRFTRAGGILCADCSSDPVLVDAVS